MMIATGAAGPRRNGLKPSRSAGRLYMAMAQLPPDFSEFLRSLEDNRVRYLVIGGYAVGHYGYPRATVDLDVWIEVSDENAGQVVRALEQFGMTTPDLAPSLFLTKGNIIRMGVPPLRIEIHTAISGVEFDACFERRERADVHGTTVNVIAFADLKANKRASGRHRDLEDLEHLE